VNLAAALAADLASLSRALDQPDVDLGTQLQALAADVARAVPSYLGFRFTLSIDRRQLSFAAYTDDDAHSQIASSMMLPLTADSYPHDGSTVALYAAIPGAFVDLAADLGFALGLDLSAVVLDLHRATPDGIDGIDGLQPWSDINRALGVMLARGHTFESAHVELRRLAAMDSASLHHAAAMVLAGAAKLHDRSED
jgi:hypothetical protein